MVWKGTALLYGAKMKVKGIFGMGTADPLSDSANVHPKDWRRSAEPD